VDVDGDAIDDGDDESNVGEDRSHSLNGKFGPMPVDSRSSPPVMIWNSSFRGAWLDPRCSA
jgi:hypothetical protein